MDRILKYALKRHCSIIEIGPVYWYAEEKRFCFNVIIEDKIAMRPRGLMKLPLIQRFKARNKKGMKLNDGMRFRYIFYEDRISVCEIFRYLGDEEIEIVLESATLDE